MVAFTASIATESKHISGFRQFVSESLCRHSFEDPSGTQRSRAGKFSGFFTSGHNRVFSVRRLRLVETPVVPSIFNSWLEHSVQVEIDAPLSEVFKLYSNLEEMPKWSPWLEGVTINPEDPTLSRWKLAARGISVSWQARITENVENEIIAWESVDGLPNRGSVQFMERTRLGRPRCAVRLSVSYNAPGWVGEIADYVVVGRIVETTLRNDLDRFRTVIMNLPKPA
mmetsp:Transcript_7818/g.13401  ORF Transcript_7818/g.13401 Transcript_7818/m.13401 type:complete len:226 (+) Transcript_7818:54-731(+)